MLVGKIFFRIMGGGGGGGGCSCLCDLIGDCDGVVMMMIVVL